MPGSTFETPQNTKALQKMADWAKAGIFNSDYNAIGYDDAAKQFAKGRGVFLYEGNWETAVVEAGLGKNVSIINMPPGPSGKHVGIGATSGPWHISAKTKYPDVAAAWLNYIIGSAPAKAAMFKYTQIPAVAGAKAPASNRLLAQATRAFQQVSEDAGLMLYTDWASTSMYDTLAKEFQLVVAGKKSPADAAKTIQADCGQVRRHAQSSAVAEATAVRRHAPPRGTPGRRRRAAAQADGPGARRAAQRRLALSAPGRRSSSGSSRWRRSCTRGGSRSSTGTG